VIASWWTDKSSRCFNFPGRKNHPEHGSAGLHSTTDARFNFPGRKNHPEPGQPGGARVAGGVVSTSPDGRTIRNGQVIRLSRSAHTGFQLPRTEEPSGTTGPLVEDGCGLRVSTSPDGRTIRNQSWCLICSGTMRFNFPGRKNHPEPGAEGEEEAVELFQLPRTEEPSGTLEIRHQRRERLPVSTSPDGRTIRNRSPRKATGGFWFEIRQRADPLWPIGPLHDPG
jgi:hypothetical protein